MMTSLNVEHKIAAVFRYDAAPAYEDRMSSARRTLSAIARRRIALTVFFL